MTSSKKKNNWEFCWICFSLLDTLFFFSNKDAQWVLLLSPTVAHCALVFTKRTTGSILRSENSLQLPFHSRWIRKHHFPPPDPVADHRRTSLILRMPLRLLWFPLHRLSELCCDSSASFASPKCLSSVLLLPVRYAFSFGLLEPSDLASTRILLPLVTHLSLFHRGTWCVVFMRETDSCFFAAG